MSLYLIESVLNGQSRRAVQEALDAVASAATTDGSELIEAQVSTDLSRLFVVIEATEEERARRAFGASNLPVSLVKEVRLVGQDLETVKARKGRANYIVEWNFPAGLQMDAYLQRKREKSVRYAQVPEVRFERTYVCEDMTKCLCFYESPDEATVRKAREVVEAPIDALGTIENLR
ncbi:MAG TPA: DUF4242 domain-containing protein [Chloroflexota bacterium]|jgi:hypothetical protein|uniref:DUF4242 domain-containing protein n=1 Tax=Thermorudis sp. TaxID=1969470 RepID=A0A7C3A8N4_9BACT